MRVTLAAAALCSMLAGEVSSKYCDGGHYCSPPKECCTLDCCYAPFSHPGYHPPAVPPPANVFNIIMWNHWYFWFLLLFLVLSCVGCCSLWHRWQPRVWWRCCCCRPGQPSSDGDFDEDDEVDDEGSGRQSSRSCCPPPPPPPHYGRCSSGLHHAPPPYTEVTAKPDLYPLVIGYGDAGKPPPAAAGSYLMVQYFRNYIVRPVGSLSATSTADSLSSSFLCSAANEANCVIPPPYSSSMDRLGDAPGSQPAAGAAPMPPPGSFVSAAALSTTGSDVSSLVGGGSPPRATSPTQEIRDILDKIQQLPLSPKRRRSSGRGLALGAAHNRHWLPRSAPTTPSGSAPPPPRPSSGGNRRWHGSASGTEDGSPLLGELCSGDEHDV